MKTTLVGAVSSALVIMCVQPRSAAAVSIGLFADPNCTECTLSISPGESSSLYIRLNTAELAGLVEAVQFRIAGLPAAWTATFHPADNVLLSVGDPFGDGVIAIYDGFVSGECVEIGRSQITTTTPEVDILLTVESHAQAFPDCPLVSYNTPVDPPRRCVNTSNLRLNGDCSVSTKRDTWSSFKQLFSRPFRRVP